MFQAPAVAEPHLVLKVMVLALTVQSEQVSQAQVLVQVKAY